MAAQPTFSQPGRQMSAVRMPSSRTWFTAASMQSASAAMSKLYRSIMAADRMQAMGLMMSWPAMSGAEPWMGS